MELTASNRSSGGPVWVPPIGRHVGVERASADAVRGRNINSQAAISQRMAHPHPRGEGRLIGAHPTAPTLPVLGVGYTGLGDYLSGTYGAALYLPGMNAGISRAER